ncbi:MAG: hypothetical protein JWL84_4336 [Rhodospirillales bacterium]|nr:hypothetical protein [Rhodospirillales bacterium]
MTAWRGTPPVAGAFLCLAVAASIGSAQEFSLNGFADARLVQPSSQQSWMNGGLGKLRYGSAGDPQPGFHFDEIIADGRALLAPGLAILGTLRAAPGQRTALDVLEAYARYQPIATSGFLWSNKLGAFYPPVSLENEGTGWSSPWSLTPSAINSWVGEELRTFGLESAIERRVARGALALTLSVYGWNDQAGTLLAWRGWAMGDFPTGIFDKPRLPDALARQFRRSVPYYDGSFKEVDDRPGWYGGLSWRENGLGRVNFLHYDNIGDPRAVRDGIVAWRTSFDSLGTEVDLGEFVVLGQVMAGETEIARTPAFRALTKFQSAYVLAGRYFGDWSLAARVDTFATQEDNPPNAIDLSEHGHAATVALSWRPRRWLRLTSEILRLDSYRAQRLQAGLAAQAVETQLQLSMRTSF